jgi:hypothetical protein
MFVTPYTYSLGSPTTFKNLGAIARKNKEWRKVARLIHKANIIIHGGMSFTLKGFEKDFAARYYICKAALSTRISSEAKEEIYKIFGLHSDSTRDSILRSKFIK